MSDVFVSYTKADETWAEWIAWALEEAGLAVVIQKWDFRPGGNFVLEMQRAAADAARTVAVLSPDYLRSAYAAPEWAAAFARDPRGLERIMVPVLVRPCRPDGLLAQLVHIDLTGLSQEEAREALVTGLKSGRAKPATEPPFPGAPQSSRAFSGGGQRTAPQAPPVRIRRAPTDIEKRRFLREGLDVIAGAFRGWLQDLQSQDQALQTDFEAEGSGFRAEVYVGGQLKANCRVWTGGMFGDNGISYAEGSTARMGNAVNETLSLADGDELAFSALMNMGVGKAAEGIDPRRMTAAEAAAYLWARFLWRLS
jgi:hypothetical protein